MAYAPTAGWSEGKRSTGERNGAFGGLGGVGCDTSYWFFSSSFFLFCLCWVSVFAGVFQKWGASWQVAVAFVAEGAGFVTRRVVVGGGFPMRRCAGRGYSRSTVYEGGFPMWRCADRCYSRSTIRASIEDSHSVE